jgi:hypothetical protein
MTDRLSDLDITPIDITDPLAAVKTAVKDTADPDLIPGRVAAVVEELAQAGLSNENRATLRAYIKREKLLPVSDFERILTDARRARVRTRTTTVPPGTPPAAPAHLHTPPGVGI